MKEERALKNPVSPAAHMPNALQTHRPLFRPQPPADARRNAATWPAPAAPAAR